MNDRLAVEALAALAQETRLRVFRLLVAAGPGGLPAGDVAQAAQVPPSTLTFHLERLERAGLVRSCRRGRQILYAAELEAMRRLLAFLTEDCCNGHPELCGGLVQLLSRCGCEQAGQADEPRGVS